MLIVVRFSQISNVDDNTRVVSSSPQPSAPPRSSPPPAVSMITPKISAKQNGRFGF